MLYFVSSVVLNRLNWSFKAIFETFGHNLARVLFKITSLFEVLFETKLYGDHFSLFIKSKTWKFFSSSCQFNCRS